jgi:hypothetical protein
MLECEDAEREHGVYEPHKARYDDESHELRELDRAVDRWEYEPQGFEEDDDEIPGYGEPSYEGTDGSIHPDHHPHHPQIPASPIAYHNPRAPTTRYPTPT